MTRRQPRGSAAPRSRRPKTVAPIAVLFGAERRRRVRSQLLEQGSVRVAELATQLGVSEETVRRDLRALAAEGLAETVHGGAVALGPAPAGLPPVERRESVEREAKRLIGAVVAGHVEPGQVVILDAGTTTLAVAHALAGLERLTVVTNSLPIAQVTAGMRGSTTYVIGGKLVPGSLSLIGPQAQRDLARISADWAFLGAAAVHPGGGFTSADPYEAEVKRAMIRAARQVAIVADATKFDVRRFASFAEAGDIHYLFTTPGVPEPARRCLESAGVRVIVCEPAPALLAGNAR